MWTRCVIKWWKMTSRGPLFHSLTCMFFSASSYPSMLFFFDHATLFLWLFLVVHSSAHLFINLMRCFLCVVLLYISVCEGVSESVRVRERERVRMCMTECRLIIPGPAMSYYPRWKTGKQVQEKRKGEERDTEPDGKNNPRAKKKKIPRFSLTHSLLVVGVIISLSIHAPLGLGEFFFLVLVWTSSSVSQLIAMFFGSSQFFMWSWEQKKKKAHTPHTDTLKEYCIDYTSITHALIQCLLFCRLLSVVYCLLPVVLCYPFEKIRTGPRKREKGASQKEERRERGRQDGQRGQEGEMGERSNWAVKKKRRANSTTKRNRLRKIFL